VKKDHAVLIMGASIAFLILALRSGAVGARFPARFAHRRHSQHRERQPYFRHARAFALDHVQPQQTKMRLQLPSSATLRIPQRIVAEI
jgi:hypothetical protein